jgi:hypothetical protein
MKGAAKLPHRTMDEIKHVRDNATGRYTGDHDPEKTTVEHDKVYSPFVRSMIVRCQKYEASGFAPDELANVVVFAVNGPQHPDWPTLSNPPEDPNQ